MTALVVVETMLLVLLSVLVVGPASQPRRDPAAAGVGRHAAAIHRPGAGDRPAAGRRARAGRRRWRHARWRRGADRGRRAGNAHAACLPDQRVLGVRRLLAGAARGSGGDRAGRRPRRGRHPRLEHGEPQPAPRPGARRPAGDHVVAGLGGLPRPARPVLRAARRRAPGRSRARAPPSRGRRSPRCCATRWTTRPRPSAMATGWSAIWRRRASAPITPVCTRRRWRPANDRRRRRRGRHRPRDRRRCAVGVVALRRVDAGQHHLAR